MLASQIIVPNFPSVNFFDKASFALRLMDEYDVRHLPILHNEKFVGLISRDDLLVADATLPLDEIEDHFIHASVSAEEHFVMAVKIAAHFEISVVPVINEVKELQGIIPQKKLIQAVSEFLSLDEPGGLIVLEMDKRHFSFGEISRLIETNDAYITQLNTNIDPISGILHATIKINKIEISDIVATLQRYEYTVKYYFGEELYENELKENYDLLMTYLKI